MRGPSLASRQIQDRPLLYRDLLHVSCILHTLLHFCVPRIDRVSLHAHGAGKSGGSGELPPAAARGGSAVHSAGFPPDGARSLYSVAVSGSFIGD